MPDGKVRRRLPRAKTQTEVGMQSCSCHAGRRLPHAYVYYILYTMLFSVGVLPNMVQTSIGCISVM